MRDPQAVREGLSLDSPARTIHVGEAGPGGGREERAAAARNDFVCGFGGGGVCWYFTPKYHRTVY